MKTYKQKLCDAVDVLQAVYDHFCPMDSYGVYGSEFATCEICGAGGAPMKPFVHKADCPMLPVEELLYGSKHGEKK